MASIPIYQPEAPIEQELPAVRQSVSTGSGEAFGVGTGRALEGLGETGEEAHIHALRLHNYAALTQARTQYETAIDSKAQGDWYNRKGDNIGDLNSEVPKFMSDTRKQVTQGFTPLQQRMFDQETLRYSRSVLNDTQRHSRMELDSYAKGQAENAQFQAAKSAAANYTSPETVNLQWGENQKAIAASNSMFGRSDEASAEYAMKSNTRFVSNVAQAAMKNNDPTAALSFLTAHKDDIDPDFHGPLVDQLNKQKAIVDSQKQVADIMPKFKDAEGHTDFDGAIKEAQDTLEGPLQDQTVARFTRLRAQQEKAILADRLKGQDALAAWRGQKGNNEMDLDFDTMKNKLHLSTPDITEIQNKQDSVGRHEPKDPVALTDAAFALKKEMREFDWDNDADGSKRMDISKRLTELSIESPKAVSPTKDGGSGAAEYWAQVTNPDPKIQGDMHTFLYKNSKGKPGGLEAEIHSAVAEGSKPGFFGNWTGQPTPTPQQVDDRAATIFQSLKSAIVKKGLETPDEVRNWLSNNTDYTQMLVNSHLGSWDANYLAHTGASGAGPKSSYNPADIR